MRRYISFTFDDGLINTALIVEKLRIPATFYIVLGWVLNEIKIKDEFNIGLNHGTIEQWKNLKLDLGCHTYDHEKKFNEHLSYSKFSELLISPKNLAVPYGLKFKSKLYDSCKIGFYGKFYNDLNITNVKEIHSINPCYDLDKESLKSVISNCPAEKWMVLTFHGINEGWKPITCQELKFWINFFDQNNFTFLTITQGVERSCRKYLL
jgi:peptidoglycan/xylan/chitin deacetylase (PgdA/CDA1 family)